jgi:hypothetical protein
VVAAAPAAETIAGPAITTVAATPDWHDPISELSASVCYALAMERRRCRVLRRLTRGEHAQRSSNNFHAGRIVGDGESHRPCVCNVVLANYDFSLEGGWRIEVDGGNNVSIINSYFAVGANINTPIWVTNGASNVTISGNTLDGSGSTLGTGANNAEQVLAINGTGTTTVEYNLIENAWSEDIQFSSDIGGESLVVQYNVIQNSGEGFNSSAHGDWIQTYNAPGANTNSFQCNYNHSKHPGRGRPHAGN